MSNFYDAAAQPMRYSGRYSGNGNAEPHEEKSVWTDADFADWNARQLAARAAYEFMTRCCRCGVVVTPHANRQRGLCDICRGPA